MTFAEFRAWLDGFSEGVGEAPTPEQWAKIREKMALVCDGPPVFIPSPLNPWPNVPAPSVQPWSPFPTITCGSVMGQQYPDTICMN